MRRSAPKVGSKRRASTAAKHGRRDNLPGCAAIRQKPGRDRQFDVGTFIS
ncbi:hypothetical protein [Falsibacillus pallidus]|nr:hypothetical protein [Falsibacillus pallidus]